jgi:hypothetical protein
MLSANQKPPYENDNATTLLFVTLLRIYMSTTKTEPKQKGTVIMTCPRIMQLHVCIASVRSAARQMHAKCHKATKSKKTNKNIRKQKKAIVFDKFYNFYKFSGLFFFQFPKITLKNL